MSMSSTLKVARFERGYCLRVEGRGTMRESRAAHEFLVGCAAREPACAIVADLSGCEYLDSTFLGCLVELKQRFGRQKPPRFSVAASPERCRKLFASARLGSVLNVVPEAPQAVGEWVTIPPAAIDSPNLPRHIMECHRLLGELGGPAATAFTKVAEQLEREIGGKGATNS